MTLEIFSVFDSKAEAFGQPFFAPTVAVAIRSFVGSAQSASAQLAQYPADFVLYHVGTFDQATGVLAVKDSNVAIGDGLQLGIGQEGK